MAGRVRPDLRRRRAVGVAFAVVVHVGLGVGLLSRVVVEALPLELPPMVVALVEPPERPPPRSSPPDRSDPPQRARAVRPVPADAPAVAVAGPDASGDAAGDLAGAVFARPRTGPKIVPRPDCLGGDPERLTPAQRAGCDRATRPLEQPAPIAGSAAKEAELAALARRKADFIRYRDNIHAPYPGLNCVYRGKCGD